MTVTVISVTSDAGRDMSNLLLVFCFSLYFILESLLLEQVFCSSAPWRQSLGVVARFACAERACADSEQKGSPRGASTSSAVIQPLKLLFSCSGDLLRGWGLPGSDEAPRGCFFCF